MCEVQVHDQQSVINHRSHSIANYKQIICFKHNWKYFFFLKRKPCVCTFDLASYCLEENLTLQETEEQEKKFTVNHSKT